MEAEDYNSAFLGPSPLPDSLFLSGLLTGPCFASELTRTGPAVGESFWNVHYILYLQFKAREQQDDRKILLNILLCKLPKDHLEIIVIFFFWLFTNNFSKPVRMYWEVKTIIVLPITF